MYSGELSSLKDARLPIFAAVGGMRAPVFRRLSLIAALQWFVRFHHSTGDPHG